MKTSEDVGTGDVRHAAGPKGIVAVHLTRHWLRLVLLALGILVVALAVSRAF